MPKQDIFSVSPLSQDLLFTPDGVFDIGKGNGNRPSVVYAAFAVQVGAAGSFQYNSRTIISSPSAGVLLLQNNLGTDFSRLQFGGTTNAFPALKRTAATLEVKLADDSAHANFRAANIQFSNGSFIYDQSNLGVITLSNAAATDFNRLQFGGTTNAFPSLKRVGANLAVRLANDADDAILYAKTVITSGVYAVAGLPAGVTGQRGMVNDSTVGMVGNFGAIVAGGGANTVPVVYDGANWRIG